MQNRDLINILTAAAENATDTKLKRARTLSMISIDEDTFKFLELKALPSPPAIPEDDVKYDSDNSGADADADDDDTSEHSNNDRCSNVSKDSNIKEDTAAAAGHGTDQHRSRRNSHETNGHTANSLIKVTTAPETTELPKLYFTLREVSSDGESDNEHASNATPSAPTSPVSSYGPASPSVSTYTATQATGSSEAIHVIKEQVLPPPPGK